MVNLQNKSGIYSYNEGINQIQNNNISGAIQCFERALMFDNKNVTGMNALGLCYYMLGMFSKALTLWETSLNLQSSNNAAVEYLSIMDSEDFKIFIDSYNNCLEYIEKKRYFAALKCIIPYKKKYPCLINILNLSGLLYYKLGFNRQAVKLWKEVLMYDLSNELAIGYLRNSKVNGPSEWIENSLVRMWEFVWKR